jgi:hypothetical protein
VPKFKHEPNGEVSGVYANGETWHVRFNANGVADVKDAEIAATLQGLADLPDHPITAVKASK